MLPYFFSDYFPVKNPVLIFAIILFLFLTMPVLMKKFRLPGMIGLLLAGALLGPNALGLLARDEAFVLLGSVGLIYIMFTAALEVDLAILKKYGVQSGVFGLLTFIIPQGLGTLIGYFLMRVTWPAAFLLGSMFASHTILAYPIVSRLGLSANRAVTATVGGTIITNILGLLVLAVVANMAQGDLDEAMWWRMAVSMTLFGCLVFIGLPRFGRWFFDQFSDDTSTHFVFILGAIFFCSAISPLAGLEPIIGAFLSGLALNRLIPYNGTLMNRLVFTGDAIFIPFFLLSVGMLLDGKVLFGSLKTWYYSVIMVVAAVGTKWLASEINQRIFGYTKDENRVVFGLSVVQAAATLAVVMVGFKMNLFDEAVVNATIVMILVTCVLGPYLVEKHASIMAQIEEPIETDEVEGLRTLVPLISADQVESSMELALLLRESRSKDPIYPVHVVIDDDEIAENKARAEKILDKAISHASSANSPAEKIIRIDHSPERAIVKIRKELGSKLVIVPWDATPSKRGSKIGHFVDSLVLDSGIELIISRLPKSLSTCDRMLWLITPETPINEEFEASFQAMHLIKAQLGMPLRIFCAGSSKAQVEEKIRSLQPDLEIAGFTQYQSSRMFLPMLTETVETRDLLVLNGVRNGSLESLLEVSDEFEQLPQRIVGKYPKNNFLMIFGRKDLQ